MRHKLPIFFLMLLAPAYAQESTDLSAKLQRVLERLDDLEKQNRELVRQVQVLRQEVSSEHTAQQKPPSNTQGNAPSLDERVAVNEARTAEQAQTKVEAAHKNPIQLTGIVLFNAFNNTNSDNSAAIRDYNLLPDSYGSGATMRQTLLGFKFQGPVLPGDGRVDGSITMDFWGGSSAPGSNWFRLRRADISLDWANRSFTVGQDKPLISPYEPDSFAEVGIPPLSGAGNLWYWLPQARYEERVGLGSNFGITGQVAVLETGGSAYQSSSETYPSPLKPALEGRLAFWHKIDDSRKFEIAPGFHVSSIHMAGASVGSRVASLDWLITPASHLSITGTVFTGQNVAGLGSLGNSIVIDQNGIAHAVHSSGGWTQFAFPITSRFTLNVFGGVENDQSEYLSTGSIVHDWSYASNLICHLTSNLVIELEGLQMRTRAASGLSGVQNHYDLAFGYLF